MKEKSALLTASYQLMSKMDTGIAALALFLLGCGGIKPAIVKTVVQPCPVERLHVECKDLNVPGKTLRELLLWEIETTVIHAECQASLNAWKAAYDGCKVQ